MLFEEKYLAKMKGLAADMFKDFQPVLDVCGDLEVLKWQNKNGSTVDNVRFVFDPSVNRMYVSGDLGSAVFQFTEPVTFERAAEYAKNPAMLQYFCEKVENKESFDYYTDDFDTFKADLLYFAETDEPGENDPRFSNKDFYELVQDLWYVYGFNGIELDEDLYNRLNLWADYSENIHDWIFCVGNRVHPKLVYWFEALRLAKERIGDIQ